jgi:hypothetical protein
MVSVGIHSIELFHQNFRVGEQKNNDNEHAIKLPPQDKYQIINKSVELLKRSNSQTKAFENSISKLDARLQKMTTLRHRCTPNKRVAFFKKS